MLDKCNTQSNYFSDPTEYKMQGEFRSVEIRRKNVFEAENGNVISFHYKNQNTKGMF